MSKKSECSYDYREDSAFQKTEYSAKKISKKIEEMEKKYKKAKNRRYSLSELAEKLKKGEHVGENKG